MPFTGEDCAVPMPKAAYVCRAMCADAHSSPESMGSNRVTIDEGSTRADIGVPSATDGRRRFVISLIMSCCVTSMNGRFADV